jgi:protein O-mannosyl-transferase
MANSRQYLSLSIFLTLLAVAFVYADVASFGHLYGDDERHIRENPHVQALTADNLLWMFSSAEIDYWRPLSFLTHAIDYTLWGEYIGGHHITNVVIHGISALLVMGIAWTVWPMVVRRPAVDTAQWRVAAALMAGLLFAVHPQHVETTAWLAERKGVLSSCFYIAAIWTYLNGRGVARSWRLATMLLVVLAMLSKPLAVSLPLALLMLDVYPLRRLTIHTPFRDWLRIGIDKLPYALLALAVSLYTYLAVETGGYLTTTDVFGLSERLVNASRSVWLYLGRFLLPLALVPIYPMAMLDNSLTLVNLIAPTALLVVAVGSLWLFARGKPALIAIAGVHMAMLGPVLGLIHVGLQSSADRYAYLPGAWMAVVAAILSTLTLMACRGKPAMRWTMTLALGLVLAAFMMLARQQVYVWSSGVAMAATVNHHFPQWQPSNSYTRAVHAYQAGDCPTALLLFEVAVAQNQLLERSHMFMADCLQQLGHDRRAQQHMAQALRIKPKSLFLMQMAVQIHMRAGRAPQAEALLARLATFAPDDPELDRQRALMFMQTGDFDGAAVLLTGLAKREPDEVRNWVLLGIVEHRRGNIAKARSHYTEALRIDPHSNDAAHNLSRLPQP